MKFKTLEYYFPDAMQISMNIVEPQASVTSVATLKCNEGWSRTHCSVVAEDTSLCFGDKELPGPYIKHFMENLSLVELVKTAEAMGGDIMAEFVSVVAYKRIQDDDPKCIKSTLKGRIVSPRGDIDTTAFNTVFEVQGIGKTLAEMHIDEYRQHCPRHANMRQLQLKWYQ